MRNALRIGLGLAALAVAATLTSCTTTSAPGPAHTSPSASPVAEASGFELVDFASAVDDESSRFYIAGDHSVVLGASGLTGGSAGASGVKIPAGSSLRVYVACTGSSDYKVTTAGGFYTSGCLREGNAWAEFPATSADRTVSLHVTIPTGSKFDVLAVTIAR
jgi:hypothetical protein